MNRILSEDIEEIIQGLGERREDFRGKSILVTGATGLLGSLIVRTFLKLNEELELGTRIIMLVWRKEDVFAAFGEDLAGKATIYEGDITEKIEVSEPVDYIVHTASPTQSKFFIEKPVETMDAIFEGTKRMLELAKEKGVVKMATLSSMEMYGTFEGEVTEADQGYIDIYNTRSSYSMGKRAAEHYAFDYFREYGVPTVAIRLAMTFGAGMAPNDNRVHKAFAEAALEGREVVVKSSGRTVVNFVYVSDAVLAILLLLLDGVPGEAYNVAGDAMGYTIMDMARYIAKAGGVEVKQEIPTENQGFAPDNLMVVRAEKALGLGWKPKYNLEAALSRLMEYLREEKA